MRAGLAKKGEVSGSHEVVVLGVLALTLLCP